VKLRTKILALLVPLVILPLLVVGWVAYGELRDISEEKLLDEMRGSLDHLSTRLADEVKTAVANIELFAKHNLVRQYVLTKDSDERYDLLHAPLLRVFRGFQEAFPAYYEIRILREDGYEDIRRTTTFLENLTDQERDSQLFKAMVANGDAVYSSVLVNPDNGVFSLFVAKPLVLRDPAVDPTGAPPSLRGYLVLTIDIQKLEASIRNDAIGKTGYLFATDADLSLVFRPDAVAMDSPVPAEIMAALRAPDAGSVPVRMELNGDVSLTEARQLLPELFLFAALPEHELLHMSRRLALAVMAITLVATVFISMFMFLVLQRFVINPVQQLRSLSKEIGRGNLRVESILNSGDELGELARSFEDMACNLRRSDEQIRYVAYHDSLTGLPNRAMFKEYLNHVIGYSKRSEKEFALLFLDIDDFKRVNDSLGHQAGDQLLQEVTDRLSGCLRKTDYVARVESFDEPDEILARLGGDEFVVLLPDINDPHAPGSLAGRLLESLSEPVFLDEHEFHIGASIGITLYPADGKSADELIKNADIAMYHAKSRGKNDYQYYLESMNVLAHERLAIENKLRRAIDNNELCLHYQPQVATTSGEIVGLEALLRWEHPEEGMIPPGVFVPVAEQCGLILTLGEWVMNEACRQVRAWQRLGVPVVPVSVNVSTIQFARQNVPELVRNAMRTSKLDPALLEIEITESAIMTQPDRAVTDLDALRDQGVAIALDDFGTGYSSFSYLHRFPIDTLKVDRSFVKSLGEQKGNQEIVAAMIAMAHVLGLRVVAEGIETDQQFRVLLEKQCDVIQGYLFKRPVPAAEIPALLQGKHLEIA